MSADDDRLSGADHPAGSPADVSRSLYGVAVAKAFVSYSAPDRAQALEICHWLESVGHEVFLDRHPRHGIAPGAEWDSSLHERLRWADAVVCVIGPSYLDAVWCTAEVAIARSRGCRILPVRTEPGIIHPLLTTVQHVELGMARDVLGEAMRRIDSAGGVGWPDDRSPFPGLSHFDVEMRRVFFGRADEIDDLANLVRSPAEQADPAVLLVVGPSGCGKSSLVRAGLVPVIAEEPFWFVLHPFPPAHHPLASLARELAAAAATVGLDWTVDTVHDRLVHDGVRPLVGELLTADPYSRYKRLLVVIDQFEEFVTQTSLAHRAEFAKTLREMLTGPVQVVATIRPEFLNQLLLTPDLDNFAARVYTMRPLRREALRTVIESPAELAGIRISEPLTSRLVEDTETGEALPLLAFTLAELARDARRGDELTIAEYERLGGVQGALVRQADAALESMISSGHTRDEVVAGLLRLISVNEDGHPTRCHVPSESLLFPFTPFVARHLLTTDGENGAVEIRVAHEAFLTSWPPLAEAIVSSATALRARHQAERAASEWANDDRPTQRLWERSQLAAVIEDTGVRIRSRTLATPLVDLNPTAAEFLYLSRRRERIRRHRAVLAIAVATAIVMALVITIQQHANEAQLRLAVAGQLQAQIEVARDTNPRMALALGVAAHHIQSDEDTRAGLVETLVTTSYRGHLPYDEPVMSTAFSPDGRVLAVGTDTFGSSNKVGSIALWDFADPGQPRLLGSASSGISDSVELMRFSPDGRTLLTVLRRDVLLWDVSAPTRPKQVGALTVVGATQAFFSPDGRTVIFTDFYNNVVRWDISNPSRPRQLEILLRITDYIPEPDDPESGILDMASSPDGRLAVTSFLDGGVMLWNVENPTRSVQLVPPSGVLVVGLTFSADGRTLVINRETGSVLWDLTDPAHPQRLGEAVTLAGAGTMAFSPDGARLAAAFGDNSVAVWNVVDRAHPRLIGIPRGGHTSYPGALAFSPVGDILVSVGEREALVWYASGPIRPMPLDPPLVSRPIDDQFPAYTEPAFAPDGRTLVVGDNTASQLWDLTSPAGPRRIGPRLNGHDTPVQATAFATDARTLLTASEERVITWDVTDRARPVRTGQYALPGPLDGFVVSDNRVVAGIHSNTILIWDLTGQIDPKPTTGLRETAGGMAMFGQSSPDGRTLVPDASTIELWDASDQENIHLISTPALAEPEVDHPVAFSPEVDTLATSSADNRLHLWDISTPTEPRHLGASIIDNHGQFYTMAYSHNGELVATSSDDGTLALWDVSDPAEPRRLGEPAYSKHVRDPWLLRFSPNDRTILVGGSNYDPRDPLSIIASNDELDKTRSIAVLWDLNEITSVRNDPIAHACAITQGGLNQFEWDQYLPDLPFEETCPSGRPR